MNKNCLMLPSSVQELNLLIHFFQQMRLMRSGLLSLTLIPEEETQIRDLHPHGSLISIVISEKQRINSS